MNSAQYHAALAMLKLKPSSHDTARALGISLRQCQRLAASENRVSKTIARLLVMYIRHGIPAQD